MRYLPSASVLACGKSWPCPPKAAGRSVTVTPARPLPRTVTVPAITPPDLPAGLEVGDCAAPTGAQKESARKSVTKRVGLMATSPKCVDVDVRGNRRLVSSDRRGKPRNGK